MNKIREKIEKNRSSYENYPEVYKYFSDVSSCVICLKKDLKPQKASILACNQEHSKQIQTVDSKNTVQKSLTADCKHFLKRLEPQIFTKTEYLNVTVKKQSTQNNRVEVYLKFLESIDVTSSSTCFRRLDEETFSEALNLNIVDEIFINFIRKLENDPLIYDKRDKAKALNILILVFSYCNRNKINVKKLKSKIEEMSFLFTPNQSFIVDLQNDLAVDKFILELRLNTCDLNEAIFMNKVYLSISKSKEYFGLFHKRLVESLGSIEEQYALSFLKYVFTHNTVLFSCIDENQLLRLILSFYQNMGKVDYTIEIFTIVMQKAGDACQTIIGILKNLCLQSKKHQKLLMILEIRSCTSFSEVIDLIKANTESFDSLNLLFGDLKCIAGYITTDRVRIDMLRALVCFFKNLKPGFIERFLNGLLGILLGVLGTVTEISAEMIQFNRITGMIFPISYCYHKE
ncbi:uncharacterized protein VICG_00457 [Vittaforma corneae ATCC 50505]|uniref:Uncharacterized protein n=1 Tax=Vittaforma corneae (strain ATCC 50505) TaxID=993615 RepID=L2GP04_VITCO|nr:uncharacterized protein VICG_00457 [Vittaforma corneae ATCC 50505]ELA42359.1 hypothetical protein VICG_00457 [Vittaforma corneae ATCC 50505]